MGAEKSKQHTSQPGKLDQRLTNWLTAVALFHAQYTQLSRFQNQLTFPEPSPTANEWWIGQCPVSQLKDLLVSMQRQLEEMLSEANQFEPIQLSRNYEILARHTLIITQLNHRAKALLGLASLTAS